MPRLSSQGWDVVGHARRVLGRPVAAVLVPAVFAPAVVDDDLVLHRRLVEEPGEELRAPPFSRGQVPLAVREDDRRLVAGHHVLELRDHVLGDVAGLVGEPERVVPLVERIVEAHPQALRAHGLRQFPEQVALRADLDRVPRAGPRWPRPRGSARGRSPRGASRSAPRTSRPSEGRRRPSDRRRRARP